MRFFEKNGIILVGGDILIHSVLVSVRDYSYSKKCNSLPTDDNDLIQVKQAVMEGLCVQESNISLLGTENCVVRKEDLLSELKKLSSILKAEDIFIFYFSGHGSENGVCLSDDEISYEDLVSLIDEFHSKSKIIILDCCYAGNAYQTEVTQSYNNFDFDKNIGKGCVIMASAFSNQNSNFCDDKALSVYTSFLCNALTNPYTIRQGKKSLESINNLIKMSANVWNEKHRNKIQNPVFRSNITGTIYFDVEKYCPYTPKEVYEECDKYIIYGVKSSHVALTKRYSIDIILKFPSTLQEIAEIANEVVRKTENYEVYPNVTTEKNLYKKPANIVWCYFGYDEDDIKNHNYICHTIWVDDKQDKSYWYSENETSFFVNNVFFNVNNCYGSIKNSMTCSYSLPEFVNKTKELSVQIIELADSIIHLWEEYNNKKINETFLFEYIRRKIPSILSLDREISNLGVAPVKIHDWYETNLQLARIVSEFTLYFDEKFINQWDNDSRRYCVRKTIKEYQETLELLKKTEPSL